MDGRTSVFRCDLHSRVFLGRRGTADEQRGAEATSFELSGNVDHLIERRCNESTEPDEIGLDVLRRLDDTSGRHHHTQVDHFIAITLQHDGHDVLAYVVNVTFDRCEHDRALGSTAHAGCLLLLFNERDQVGDGLLHHSGALHDLRKEHAPAAEQVTDHVHASHQRPFDNVDGMLGVLSGLLRVLLDVICDALDERVGEPRGNVVLTP